ncbi:hypothetical protein [Oxynema sp. CENA135]|nr:hypothetical protein [Oxynema sp. CENA135]
MPFRNQRPFYGGEEVGVGSLPSFRVAIAYLEDLGQQSGGILG